MAGKGTTDREAACSHQSAGRPSVPSSLGAVGRGPADLNTAAV